MGWTLGLLVVAFTVVQLTAAIRDSRRDVAAPYRVVVELPEPGPDAWRVRGACRFGVWSGGLIPGARITVTPDWIGVRRVTLFSGVRHDRVERPEVEAVVVIGGLLRFLGVGIGVIGRDGPLGLAVYGTNRTDAEAALDQLGWPHVRRGARVLRPFA